ncbi:hypothetical protein THF1C08_110010 [Vibrio jasicida]|uniref:Uncharacterized protein n=1 Tax=Vibrio jasicida TaxID=766224 RepID=A0AAU9QEP1_9VIBR|nr:hypothetical protein THF1C08_110010 [Vibrio jasicida]CAH1568321.1 hypothetical protein THF1A12_100010 [Vibrio jasicida]
MELFKYHNRREDNHDIFRICVGNMTFSRKNTHRITFCMGTECAKNKRTNSRKRLNEEIWYVNSSDRFYLNFEY